MITNTTTFGNLYLGNKMSGIPFFNAPWFDETAAILRLIPGVREVFNPAEWDRLRGFEPMKCPNGTFEEASEHGFVLREALGSDWQYIADRSNGLIIGPDWQKSPGTISEIACHQALRLPVWEWQIFERTFWRHIEFRPQNAEELFDPQWQLPPLTNYLL